MGCPKCEKNDVFIESSYEHKTKGQMLLKMRCLKCYHRFLVMAMLSPLTQEEQKKLSANNPELTKWIANDNKYHNYGPL